VTDQPTAASPFDDGELYDLWCNGLDYAIDFYVALARQAKGPVLEIACGTGRIMLPCLQAGADVDGLDNSEPMLTQLRKKAAALNLAPRLFTADMSDFRLPRQYALITITFNAFCHNLTQDAQIRCLTRCREHLAPGGMLAFDGFFPGSQYVATPENTRVLEGETKHPTTGHTLRTFDTRTMHRVEQVQHSINEVEVIDSDGKITMVHRSEHDARWVYKDEMALLLRVAGFSRWDICGDFERKPLTQETDGMVVLAWVS